MLEGRKEAILPNIAYPDALYAERATSLQLVSKILEYPGPVGRGRKIATSLDLHRTPGGMSDQDILDSVSTYTGFYLRPLEAQPEDDTEKAERERAFVQMNEALKEAKSYVERVLDIKAPDVVVTTKQDIIDLIRKTQRYGEPDRRGLETHAGYCALVSVALATFELQKKESHMLAGEKRSLEDFLTVRSEANGHAPLFDKHYAVDIVGPTTVTLKGNPPLQVRLSMRDKDPDSQITKYLMKPESNAKEALKDAVGMRLEVENRHIEEALMRVVSYLQGELGASDLELENKKILDDERFKSFTEHVSEEALPSERMSMVSDKNPLSADSFRVVKVLGDIKIPGKNTTRSIEIQFVEPENKNDRKLSSHAVYELKKKITVMTRLFGGCSEPWLRTQLEKIAKTGGYAEKTLEGLKGVGFLMQLPGTKKVYGAISVYDRWLRVRGLIEDPAVRKQIIHGLGLKSDPLDKTLGARA